MKRTALVGSTVVWLAFLAPIDVLAEGPRPAPGSPTRVLITNDNGIDDPKLVALARAFAARAEVWVVAPTADRSGSGNHISITRRSVEVTPRDLGEDIRAFAVDGYPADCILLAVSGLMKDAPPDLVVSGINGGANLGVDWMFSGTVGAARVAALAGLPALAVSGLRDELPGAVDAAAAWVVRLAFGATVQELRRGEYLTVSLPRTRPEEILGVRITDRAPLTRIPRFASADDGKTWRPVGVEELGDPSPSTDESAFDAGFIAVVPMRADEVHHELLSRWLREAPELPEWVGGSDGD